MKISKKQIRTTAKLTAVSGLAGLTFLLMPISATAQPGPHQRGGPGSGPPKCMPAHVQKQLPLFDINKNGRLDPEEHHAMREAERNADLKAYDADGDGLLSKEERANLHHGKMVERFEELDVNRNAEISVEEASGSCTPLEQHFAHADSDGSGSISWAEFENAAPKNGPGGRGGPDHCAGKR